MLSNLVGGSSARSNPSRHKSQRPGDGSYHRLRTIDVAAENRGNRCVSLAYRRQTPASAESISKPWNTTPGETSMFRHSRPAPDVSPGRLGGLGLFR